MTALDIQHYDHHQAAELCPLLLDVYAEVYADAAKTDPFATVDRFAQGLDGRSRRPGWTCAVGYDGDEPVGYVYGAPLPNRAPWWGGLLTEVPADVVDETGTRAYALSELMVRLPWRKTGSARRLHDALLAERPEERATLLVDQDHPKVHALYESCARASPTPSSSTPCCSTSPSTDRPGAVTLAERVATPGCRCNWGFYADVLARW